MTTFFGLFLSAVIMYVVSNEVLAALKAVQYANTSFSKDWPLARKVFAAWVRYQWSSMLFHEAYCARIQRIPAYRLAGPGLATGLMLMAYGVAGLAFGVDVAPMVAVGSSVMVGLGLFAFTSGKTFLAVRADVIRQTEVGSWVIH